MRRKVNATKKKGKPKALGLFEYDDIPDSFLVSSGSNSSHESEVENCNPNQFPSAPKVKTKRKKRVEPPDDACSIAKTVVAKSKPKSLKRLPSRESKTTEEEEYLPTKRRQKLAPSSLDVDSACQLPTRKLRRAKVQGGVSKTKESVKGKGKRAGEIDENSETDIGLASGFSPSKLRGQQTSTPAPNKTVGRRNKQPLRSLANILSPLPIVKTPSAVNFNDSLDKSDRFGKSYTRESMSGLKRKRKRKKKVVPGYFDDDTEEEEDEEEVAVACPTKKPKKMTMQQQKEERYAKWAAEVNAEFSDIEQHELCVEST